MEHRDHCQVLEAGCSHEAMARDGKDIILQLWG